MTEQPKDQQCRHILADGYQCRAPCLRNESFCYYHHTSRPRGAEYRRRSILQPAFELPNPEDRSSVQAGINEVLLRIAGNSIDLKRAGLILYAYQIASHNLPKHQSPSPNKEVPKQVTDIVHDPDHGDIAVERNYQETYTHSGKSLAEELMEEWKKEPEDGFYE